ncbi:deoxyribonuclease IV [uncultured Tessaracoccus sp.]|uniref:deoxyribonuclease IV n=1 Tax=uncultured Tessaracoccus sp. TaxID=905023 RepID=UPI002610AD97|nr:deoxyribonuclease IV [uncultured Tessaracoccus sp.]
MSFPVGAHVNSPNPLDEARELGVKVVQLVLGDPQSWKKPTFHQPGLKEEAAAAGVQLFVHSPFIINVASTNNRIRVPSRRVLQQHVDAAAEIGARGVVVHGGHVTADDDPAVGVENWRKCVDGLELPVPILIENTAGGKHAMARYLESLAALWDGLRGSENLAQVGFCFDTCHAFAAGLNLTSVVDDMRAITGRIDLVHLNDSERPAGSGADRHASLGDGLIPDDELVAMVRAAEAPAVLETPGGVAEHARDLEWINARL